MSEAQKPENNRQQARGAAGDQARSATLRAAAEMRDAGHEIVHEMSETVARTADVAADATHRVAEQGREAMMLGVRAAARVNGRYADLGLDHGQHTLAAMTRAMDIYREAGERTADNMQALFSSYLTLGRGVQQIQHAWLDQLDQGIGRAVHKPQDLLRCGTLEEFAEVQRDLYYDAVRYAIDSTTRLLELAGRAAQEATRPLNGQKGPTATNARA